MTSWRRRAFKIEWIRSLEKNKSKIKFCISSILSSVNIRIWYRLSKWTVKTVLIVFWLDCTIASHHFPILISRYALAAHFILIRGCLLECRRLLFATFRICRVNLRYRCVRNVFSFDSQSCKMQTCGYLFKKKTRLILVYQKSINSLNILRRVF